MSLRCLRQKPRISYSELEEPSFDEYIFCDKCSDDVYEYCSIHGPLLVIPDNKIPANPNIQAYVPKAALTIPDVFLHLAPSSIPGAGIGVFATLTLPAGVRFGPYKGKVTDSVDSNYCWQIYDSNHKPVHCIDAVDANKSNWMRYVNCSRHWSEQNLVAFQYQGQLYYRTIKIIPKYTELLVFYGSEFANELDIDLGRYNNANYAKVYDHGKIINNKGQDTTTASDFTNKIHNSRGINNYDNIGNTHLEISTHTREKPFACVTCNLKFSKKSSIKTHMRTHTGEKLFACVTCNMKFSWKNNLKRHMRTHTGEKPFACVTCNMKFSRKNNLITHMRTHTGEKPFACVTCNMKFSRKNNLITHMRTHTGEKPFACVTCNFKFSRKSLLKSHMRTHTGEKPFACTTCERKFSDPRSLKKHVERIHIVK